MITRLRRVHLCTSPSTNAALTKESALLPEAGVGACGEGRVIHGGYRKVGVSLSRHSSARVFSGTAGSAVPSCVVFEAFVIWRKENQMPDVVPYLTYEDGIAAL